MKKYFLKHFKYMRLQYELVAKKCLKHVFSCKTPHVIIKRNNKLI